MSAAAKGGREAAKRPRALIESTRALVKLIDDGMAGAASRGHATAAVDENDAAGASAAAGAAPAKKKRSRSGKPQVPKIDPLTPPPPASEFPPYAPRDFFRYELIHQSKKSNARVGRIHTPHGVIDTPGFVAVGTMGALKAVPHQELQAANLQLMFSNTYHLMLQPGADLVENAGGLHAFIGRDAPIITDSGGFQVFSLARPNEGDGEEMKSRRASKQKGADGLLLRVNEAGALFRSYRDGVEVALTPESSVLAQKKLGADIIIPLDELPPYHIDDETLRRSVYLSHRWEARSLRTHLEDVRRQAMYAVVHGGVDRELRVMSARYLASLPFDGFAIGGSVGKDTAEVASLLSYLVPLLPPDRPRHLLGVGDEKTVLASTREGVDTFDSTFPSKNARHGQLMTRTRGTFNVARAECARMHEPPCRECGCALCVNHTVSYLHHLVKANEPTAATLMTAHNLHYMGWLMRDQREKILNDEI